MQAGFLDGHNQAPILAYPADREIMKRTLQLAGTLLAVACTALFVHHVATSLSLDTLRSHLDSRTVAALILSAMLYSMTVPLSALAWQRLLANRMHAGFLRLCAILMTSQVGKYLPGNIGHVAGRTALALRMGIPMATIAASIAYETLLLLATGILVGVVGAATSQAGMDLLRLHGTMLAGIVAACVAGLVALPLLARLLPKLAARFAPGAALQTGDAAALALQSRDIAFVTGSYATAYVIIGLSAATLAFGLDPVRRPDTTLLISAFAIAWTMGFVTPGAPAGIGVREALLMLMLGPALGTGMATLLVLFMRAATILGDILCLFSGMALMRNASKKRTETEPEP